MCSESSCHQEASETPRTKTSDKNLSLVRLASFENIDSERPEGTNHASNTVDLTRTL
jgi:hypothetical protein